MFPAGFQRQECVQCLESSGREVDQRAGEEWQVTGSCPVLDKMYVDIVDTLGNVVFDHKCSK